MRAFWLASTLLASAACLLPTGQALAQTDEGATLETVVVTAQRKEENLQTVPVAVDVIQGQQLADKGVTDLATLQSLSPALTVQPTSSGNSIFLRGVGNFTLTGNADPTVAFNYDGVYVGRPASTYGVFYDLQRVEILKGPQGILYGRNATGGAINVIPVQPDLKGFSGNASLSLGNYGAVQAQAAATMPVTDSSAMRAAVSYSKHDGYLDDGLNDDDTVAFRLQYLAQLTPDLKIRLAGDYARSKGAGVGVSYGGRYQRVGTTYSFVPTTLPISSGLFTPAAQAYRQSLVALPAGRLFDALAPRPSQDNRFGGLNGEASWDSPIGVVTFTPAWRRTRLDETSAAAGFMFMNDETITETSAELRLNGRRIGLFDYTAGLYGYRMTDDAQTAISASSQGIWASPLNKARSMAAFGSVTANLTDDFRISAGLRYTVDRKSVDATSVTGLIVCGVQPLGCNAGPAQAKLFPLVASPADLPFTFPVAGGPPVLNGAAIIQRIDSSSNQRLTQSRPTYRVSLEYDLAPRSMLYASFETGYRSGGFNNAVGFLTYEPEYITAYTVGMKNRLFDNRVQLNVEGFYWDYRNQQVSHVGVDLAGKTANFVQNIGSSTIRGLEVEGLAQLTPLTRVSADVQYLDARNDSFVYNQSAVPPAAPPVTGCAYSAGGGLYTVDCSDKPGYNAPKWTVNLGIEQVVPVGEFELTLGADTHYQSSRYIGFNYLPQQLIEANWTSNASLAFGPHDGAWRASAWVRNIEGDRTPNFSALNPVSNALTFGTAAPRTYGVTLSTRF